MGYKVLNVCRLATSAVLERQCYSPRCSGSDWDHLHVSAPFSVSVNPGLLSAVSTEEREPEPLPLKQWLEPTEPCLLGAYRVQVSMLPTLTTTAHRGHAVRMAIPSIPFTKHLLNECMCQ